MNDRNIRIVIPVHQGKDVKPGLIRAIIKESGLSRQDFFRLIKEKR
jgi:predicted RNA binding protein YcfA (HicA-like mRNA interferase family)